MLNINIQSVRFQASETLETLVTKKLQRAFAKYPYITNAHVFLKKENDNEHQQTVEIQLNIKNKELFAQSTEQKFENALTETIGKLKRQLEKYKQKLYANP